PAPLRKKTPRPPRDPPPPPTAYPQGDGHHPGRPHRERGASPFPPPPRPATPSPAPKPPSVPACQSPAPEADDIRTGPRPATSGPPGPRTAERMARPSAGPTPTSSLRPPFHPATC